MALQLRRPIVFFDLETTGVNILEDRIVEISYIKVMPNGEEKERTYRVNPERSIPEAATAVHHITDEDVKDKPTFKQIAQELANEFTGCDFGGFNSNRFDIPMLAEEFARANVEYDFSRAKFIDAQTIFHKKEPRTLVAAYRFYCNAELEGAHSANADIRATFDVLKAQLERYADLPGDVESLSIFCGTSNNVDLMGRIVLDEKGREIINFGKHKGKTVEDTFKTDLGYYDWIMRSDFTQNTKQAFTRIYLRMKQDVKK